MTTQYLYMDQEIGRKSKIETYASDRDMFILDRSILSVLAFAYNMYKLGISDIRWECFSYFKAMYEKGNILIPEYYILLVSDYQSAYQRFEQGEGGMMAKGSAAILIDPGFVENYNAFIEGYLSCIPSECYMITEYRKDKSLIDKILYDCSKDSLGYNHSESLLQYIENVFVN